MVLILFSGMNQSRRGEGSEMSTSKTSSTVKNKVEIVLEIFLFF